VQHRSVDHVAADDVHQLPLHSREIGSDGDSVDGGVLVRSAAAAEFINQRREAERSLLLGAHSWRGWV